MEFSIKILLVAIAVAAMVLIAIAMFGSMTGEAKGGFTSLVDFVKGVSSAKP